jgi:hypothetical protein
MNLTILSNCGTYEEHYYSSQHTPDAAAMEAVQNLYLEAGEYTAWVQVGFNSYIGVPVKIGMLN